MIQSALVLMGQKGVEATSFSQVIEHSGAPRGSIYHHFPGGKAQLVEEATRYAGQMVVDLAAAQVDSGDPLAGLKSIGAFWRGVLQNTDFAAGCPVIAASLEARELPGAREAACDAFQRFQDVHFQLLRRAGVSDDRARSLAAVAVSGVEGAIILSRAERSDRPLERVLSELTALFTEAVDQAKATDERETIR
jgi:AcrR family transcriptional regulator